MYALHVPARENPPRLNKHLLPSRVECQRVDKAHFVLGLVDVRVISGLGLLWVKQPSASFFFRTVFTNFI